jgi:acetylornithine deacetylase
MVPVLTALEVYHRELQERPLHPLTGGPTLAVTLIQGGSQINVVPDHCWIAIDRRLLPGEVPEAMEAEIAAAIRRHTDVELEWEPVILDYSMEIDPDDPIVRRLAAAVQHVTGRAPSIGGVSYGTDASKFVRAGIPAVVFGAGSITRAHTAEEYLEIDQLEQAVEIHARILRGD